MTGADFDVDLAAVFAAVACFEAGVAAFHDGVHPATDLLEVFRRVDPVEGHALHFVHGVAKHVGCRLVDFADISPWINHPESV